MSNGLARFCTVSRTRRGSRTRSCVGVSLSAQSRIHFNFIWSCRTSLCVYGSDWLCRYAIPVDRIHCHIRTHYYLCKRLHPLGSGHTQFEYICVAQLCVENRFDRFDATLFDVEYLVFSLWPTVDTTTNSHGFLFCCSFVAFFLQIFSLSDTFTHSHTHTTAFEDISSFSLSILAGTTSVVFALLLQPLLLVLTNAHRTKQYRAQIRTVYEPINVCALANFPLDFFRFA